MSGPEKDEDQEKGDEVLRRLLKTSPDNTRKSGTSQKGEKKPSGSPAKNCRSEGSND